MLRDIIPAAHRKVVYGVYAAVGVLLGAIQVGYSSAEHGQPDWLTVTLAVYAFLGGALGATAAGNTPVRHDDNRGLPTA